MSGEPPTPPVFLVSRSQGPSRCRVPTTLTPTVSPFGPTRYLGQWEDFETGVGARSRKRGNVTFSGLRRWTEGRKEDGSGTRTHSEEPYWGCRRRLWVGWGTVESCQGKDPKGSGQRSNGTDLGIFQGIFQGSSWGSSVYTPEERECAETLTKAFTLS